MTTVDVAQRPQPGRRGHLRRLPGPGEGDVRRRPRSATGLRLSAVNSINWARLDGPGRLLRVRPPPGCCGRRRPRRLLGAHRATSATSSPAGSPGAWARRSASCWRQQPQRHPHPLLRHRGHGAGRGRPHDQPEHGHPGVQQPRAPALRALRPGRPPPPPSCCTRSAPRVGSTSGRAPAGRGREVFDAGAVDDDRDAGGDRRLTGRADLLVDPHTAVGLVVADALRRPGAPMVCLATAHPAKFPDAVEAATGEPALPAPPRRPLRADPSASTCSRTTSTPCRPSAHRHRAVLAVDWIGRTAEPTADQ